MSTCCSFSMNLGGIFQIQIENRPENKISDLIRLVFTLHTKWIGIPCDDTFSWQTNQVMHQHFIRLHFTCCFHRFRFLFLPTVFFSSRFITNNKHKMSLCDNRTATMATTSITAKRKKEPKRRFRWNKSAKWISVGRTWNITALKVHHNLRHCKSSNSLWFFVRCFLDIFRLLWPCRCGCGEWQFLYDLLAVRDVSRVLT